MDIKKYVRGNYCSVLVYKSKASDALQGTICLIWLTDGRDEFPTEDYEDLKIVNLKENIPLDELESHLKTLPGLDQVVTLISPGTDSRGKLTPNGLKHVMDAVKSESQMIYKYLNSRSRNSSGYRNEDPNLVIVAEVWMDENGESIEDYYTMYPDSVESRLNKLKSYKSKPDEMDFVKILTFPNTKDGIRSLMDAMEVRGNSTHGDTVDSFAGSIGDEPVMANSRRRNSRQCNGSSWDPRGTDPNLVIVAEIWTDGHTSNPQGGYLEDAYTMSKGEADGRIAKLRDLYRYGDVTFVKAVTFPNTDAGIKEFAKVAKESGAWFEGMPGSVESLITGGPHLDNKELDELLREAYK